MAPAKKRRRRKTLIEQFNRDMQEAIRAWKREQMRLYRNGFRVKPYYPRPKARKSYKKKQEKKPKDRRRKKK